MRTYKYSIAALKAPGSRFKQLVLDTIPVYQLFLAYQLPLYMIVHDSYLETDICIDMADIKADTEYRTISFSQYLNDTQDRSLPYTTDIPELSTKYIKYADVFYAGYDIQRQHPEMIYDPTADQAELIDAKLTKPEVDYKLLYRNALFTINGFFHSTDADSTGLYIKDAFKSLSISRANNIGITSFYDVGELTFKRFHTDIDVIRTEDTLLNGCQLDFKEDISNTFIMFVIGGYLFYHHPAFTRSSPNGFRVRFDLLDLPNRYFEMREFIDVKSLNVEFDEFNPDMTLYSRLQSDDYITRLLDLSQSFAILVHSPALFYEEEPIHLECRAPWAETPILPDKPLIADNGRLLDYHWRYGWDEQYLVHVQKHFNMRNMFHTHNNKYVPINSQLDPNNPLPLVKPSFLSIGTDI
jgi:hypothetical protein